MNFKPFKKSFRQTLLSTIFILSSICQFAWPQSNGYWDERFAANIFDNENYIDCIGVTNDGDIFVSGLLSVNRTGVGIMKWNGTGWSPFGRMRTSVNAFLVVGDDLYLGGGFTKVDSLIPANRIAKYNLVTQTWSPLGSEGSDGVDHIVFALAAEGNDLYVAGAFTTAGGIPANHVAKYNTVTKTWTPLGDGVDGSVQAIAVKNGEVYVGSSVSGVSANNIAKWNGREWSALGGGVNSQVLALTFLGDDLYVGGLFSQAGGSEAQGIAKWNTSTQTWSDVGGGIENGAVFALASNGREVYVGGSFNHAGGMQAGSFTKWNPAKSCWSRVGGSRHGDGGSVDGQVNAIVIQGNDFYLGGKFGRAGGKPSHLFAIWHEPLSPSPHAPAWSSAPDVTFLEDDSTRTELYQYVTDTEHDLRGLAFQATVIDFQSDFRPSPSSFGNESIRPQPNGTNGLQIRLEKVIMGPVGRFVYATFTSAKDASGVYTAAFTVTDPCGEAASDTIQVTVTPLNDAPAWSPLPNLTFREDGRNRLELPKYVSDADDSLAALSFKAEVIGKQAPGGKWQKTSALQVTINPATKIANFKASPDSFGVFKVALMATDPGQLADTTTMQVRVKPSNDTPVIANLPETLTFRNTASKRLAMWDFVSDVDDADSSLHFSFATSNDSLKRKFDAQTGVLILTAPGFIGKTQLFIAVRDDSNAVARDTIDVHVDRTVSVAESNSEIPTEFVLLQNYPNPFSANGAFGNPTTLIRFGLPSAVEVKLEVFDLSGQRVATLLNERKFAGFHDVEFNASGLSSGTYFYKLTAGSFGERKKLLLVK